MKRLIIIVLILVVTLPISAQSRWKGFWKPVTTHELWVDDITTDGTIKADRGSLWLYRPIIQVSALSFMPTGDERIFEVGAMNSAGAGISYSNFVEIDGLPYNRFAVNGLILSGYDLKEVSPMQVSLAITATLLEKLSFGGGWNFARGKPFILTGVAITFN
jgi:hypothetical protein